MKTYNHLFEQIIDKENIRKAVFKAARGKRKKSSVRKALKHIDETVDLLHEELKSGTWRPIALHYTKQINDGVELKKRYIVCPRFVQEQCVHHAIMNIVEPLFRKKFYPLSCGSVKGRGAEQVKKFVAKAISNKPKDTKYFVKLDIKKFFHNARPSFIFHELRRTIRDKRVLRLFALILRANVQMINGVPVKGGIPIGFYTSPHFANVLLNPIDHMAKEILGVKFYVRYMDDMLLMDSNKRRLKKAAKAIEGEIEKRCMRLKPIWQVHKWKSFNFLGYQFKHDRVRLRDRIFLKAVRLIKRIKAKVKITIHDCLRVLSYVGRFKNADTWKAFHKYISPFVNIREMRTRISKFFKKGNK